MNDLAREITRARIWLRRTRKAFKKIPKRLLPRLLPDRIDGQPSPLLLGPLETPKPSRVLAIINSAFFLWLLTAALVTAGGALIAGYQQCVREAEALGEMQTRLSDEIHFRHAYIFDLVKNAESTKDLEVALDKIPVRDFKERPLPTLIGAYYLRKDRIDHSILDKIRVIPIPGLEQKREGYIDIVNGKLPTYIEDFANFKIYAAAIAHLAQGEYELWSGRVIRPNCSPRTVFRGAVLGTDERIAILRSW
jgi:hypothetical protein